MMIYWRNLIFNFKQDIAFIRVAPLISLSSWTVMYYQAVSTSLHTRLKEHRREKEKEKANVVDAVTRTRTRSEIDASVAKSNTRCVVTACYRKRRARRYVSTG